MKIVQVNTHDIAGGAEKTAFSLHNIYRKRGHWSKLIVGFKHSLDTDTIAIDNSGRGKGKRLFKIAQEKLFGWQYLDFPGSHRISELVNEPFDIIHFHNLHGGYFDLAALPRFARLTPIVMVLHDMWLLTGHCANPFSCDRWQTGCGQCPDLSIPPATCIDGTGFNWRRKRQILSSLPIFITAPSQWMLDQVGKSYLSSFESRLIRNGVDQQIFSPGSKLQTRHKLGFPKNQKIILFSANSGLLNIWKDGATLIKSLQLLLGKTTESEKPVIINLGGNKPRPRGLGQQARRLTRRILNYSNEDDLLRKAGLSDFVIRPGKINNANIMADYYRASDILVYATKTDNCPLTIIEALSCGLPVIASAVGGVPELIKDGETGMLVKPGDANALLNVISHALGDEAFRARLSSAAIQHARQEFDIRQQATKYIDLYSELIRKHQENAAKNTPEYVIHN